MQNPPQNHRYLVTGATGFIGGHLARRLHAEGKSVTGLARAETRARSLVEEGIPTAIADITDTAAMARVLEAGRFDVVMHIAAWLGGDPHLAHAANVEATFSLAQACAAQGVKRLIYTSSIAVYGPHGDLDVDESAPLLPYGDIYGDTKIESEQALLGFAQQSPLEIVIIRPGMVYGPGSRGWTLRLNAWARRGILPLINAGRGTAYPVYIDNLVDLLILAASHTAAPGQVFNGVDDGPVTYAEFFGGYMAMIPSSRALRLPGWLLQGAAPLLDPFVRARSLRYLASQLIGCGQVSNRKARELLGWEPRISLSEGLTHCEVWLRDLGHLPPRSLS